jgi:hypothetical protein
MSREKKELELLVETMLRKNYALQKKKQKADLQAINQIDERIAYQEKVIEAKETLVSIENRIQPKDLVQAREALKLQRELDLERRELDDLASQQKALLESITREIQDHRQVATKIEERERSRIVEELNSIESSRTQILGKFEGIRKQKLDSRNKINVEK